MRNLMTAVAFGLWSGAALAGELNDQFSEMGTMTVEMGETRMELVIPYDEAQQIGYAEQKMIAGTFLTINTAAQMVDADGNPSGDLVQVTLQEHGGSLTLLSAEIYGDEGWDAPLAMGADGGSGALTSYTFEDNFLNAEVQGTFLRLTGYMSGEPKVAEGATPQEAVIRWEVTLPPLE